MDVVAGLLVALAILGLGAATRNRLDLQILLCLVAIGGGYLLYKTGDHGAEMVFRYGVGVQNAEENPVTAEPGLTIGADGWQWQPQSDTAWTGRMTWLEGDPGDVAATLDTTDTGQIALTLRPTAPIMFVVPDTLGAVQVIADVNADAFDGTVTLLHHAQGAESYDFLSLNSSSVQQGRVAGGERSTFATETVEMEGGARSAPWATARTFAGTWTERWSSTGTAMRHRPVLPDFVWGAPARSFCGACRRRPCSAAAGTDCGPVRWSVVSDGPTN